MNRLTQLRIAPPCQGLAFGVLLVTCAAMARFGISRLSNLTAALALMGGGRIPQDRP